MISKESEYLIQIAEEQLERLNKSLYLYQKNSEMESDILSSSLSLSCSNNFKESSSVNVDINTNVLNLKTDLKPIYKIIKNQKNECSSDSSFKRKLKDKEKKKQHHKMPIPMSNSDHIRDWRNGVNLVKKTLGSNNRISQKSPVNKSQSTSPCSLKKKQRISTFWNDECNKRNCKSPKKDISHSDKTVNNCCLRRTSDKEEIQRYIKYKQKAARDKRLETETMAKARKENIKASLNSLENYHQNNFMQYLSSRQNYIKPNSEPEYVKSRSMSSLNKTKLVAPIYDELEREGYLEYFDMSKYDHHFIPNLTSKYKNGLNSTVDSGIETGEWYRSLTPEKFRSSYERINEHNSYLPPPLPPSSKPLSQTDLRLDTTYKSSKLKTDHYNKLKQKYQEQISAYDASSENELAHENFDKNTASPELSVVSDEVVKIPKSPLVRIKVDSNDNPNSLQYDKSIVVNPKISENFEKINEITNRNDIRIIYENLTEALLTAQIPSKFGDRESEKDKLDKISQAVQNFIKTKESIECSRTSSCLSLQSAFNSYQNIKDTNCKSKSKVATITDSQCGKKNCRKVIPTELEASEMELELATLSSRTAPNNHHGFFKENAELKIQKESIPENLSINDELIRNFNVPEPININEYKETLQKREERANELIKLTKNLQKESKRVIKLEKKAFEISKKFIPNMKSEKKNSTYEHNSTRVESRNEESLKFSSISCLKSDLKSTENQQSLKMTDPQFQLSDNANKSPQFDKGCQSQSSQSENDEITISISEVTTTLTDQSELEARLLALRSEMEKKKQLVSTLKRRQKEIKRDKIKQKEIVLQKQIDMYDNYLEKLQTTIDQLSSKIDDDGNNSDDSHTLTGSNCNLTDLDGKKDHVDMQNDFHSSAQFVDNNKNESEIILITNVIPILSKENIETQDLNRNVILKSRSRLSSLDSLIENNKHVQINDLDLDNLSDMVGKCQEEVDKDNESVSEIDKPQSDIENLINFSPPEVCSHINSGEMVFGDVEESNLSNFAKRDDLFDSFFNSNSGDCSTNANRNANLLLEHDQVSTYLNDLLPKNAEDNESVHDDVLQQLYINANSSDTVETNIILDALLSINSPINLSVIVPNSVNSGIPCSDLDALGSSESKNDHDEKKTPEMVKDIVEICIEDKENVKEDEFSSSSVSVKIVENNYLSDSNLSSSSSSINENNFKLFISKENDIKPVAILVENIYNEDENYENRILNAETISIDGSSISDVDSFNNFIEEDSLENANLCKISPKNSDENLFANKTIQLNASSLNIHTEKIDESSNQFLKDDTVKFVPEQSLSSCRVDELVDILLNKLILTEIENIKPNLAETEQQKVNVHTPESVVEFQLAPFNDEDTYDEPIILERGSFFDVLKSEDLWELGDLTVEDSNKVINLDGPPTLDINKDLLKEKLSWLIPLKSENIEPLIESATRYCLEYKKKHGFITERALSDSETELPDSYIIPELITNAEEIFATLFESTTTQPHVDKRIVFHIVLEILLEIFSFEHHLCQPSWVHSSAMLKNNIYSLWKGVTPPESFDLVRRIVRERVDVLINQKDLFLTDGNFSAKETDSQSKIIKWCIRQQKDDVDKLLINDLRKEENEWIYYDDAEEEVKFQIAEEIFHILIIDTISWIKSISDIK